MKYVLPSIITLVIIFAIKTHTAAYEAFTDGAADGMKIAARIFPSLLAVVTAAQMLRASGAVDMITGALSPLTSFFNIPGEVVPLILIRPVSGSGSLGILSDILNSCGADSAAGKLASVIMGSTETTFYCLCIYFAKTSVTDTKKVILCAVIGDLISLAAGAAAVNSGIFGI